jgi:DNA-binding GntR family transcriptional regulator
MSNLGTRVRSVERVHERLRTLIVEGTYPPGSILSQVQLARMFGVSRTPLREALRRLEAEGLIEAEQNQRARVATVDAEALDVLFTDGILLEAMGIKVTVPRLSEIDLNAILASIAALRIATDNADEAAQARARRGTHQLLVAHAGERLRDTILGQYDRSENYRRLYVPLPPDASAAFAAIGGACIQRDADEAARQVARFEVGLFRGVLRAVAPNYEPVAIEVALRMLDR